MNGIRFKNSVAQAYRWSLAGLVAAGITNLEGLPVFNPFTYLLGIPLMLIFIIAAAGGEYLIQSWIAHET
jgi:hypothetical protein